MMLAKSQLFGGHKEYLVLCGFGIPSLRLLWGAVRNRQCKSCISPPSIFQFFFYNLHVSPQEHKYTSLPKKWIFFKNNLHISPQKKNTQFYHKIPDWTIFFTSATFFCALKLCHLPPSVETWMGNLCTYCKHLCSHVCCDPPPPV